MFSISAAAKLNESDSVLLAGMGGGYDLYAALPIYFALCDAGKRVYLANLSFATIYASNGKRHPTAVVEVDSRTVTSEAYFPEYHLAQWLRKVGEPDTIYCFDRTGAAPIAAAYRYLCDALTPDAIVLIDGGTDSLMRGDEPQIGTPQEDIASLAAMRDLPIETKLLAAIGFGIDTYHGVCHAYFLEAVADLMKAGGYHGVWALTNEMPEVKRYQSACDYIFNVLRAQRSIVNSSILAATHGQFGDIHATNRTEGSELFINPLMSMYWFFDADAVARRNLYIDAIRETRTYDELSLAIEEFRATWPVIRLWKTLPM